MSDPKVSLQFRLVDLVSGPARRVAAGVAGIGQSAKKAFGDLGAMGARFDGLVSGIEASVGRLNVARDLKSRLVDPMLKAAGEVESAKKALEIALPQGPDLQASVRGLSRSAAETAGPTRFSDSEIMRTQVDLLKDGFTAGDAKAGGKYSAMLAEAEGLNLEQSSASIKALRKTFNLSSEQLGGGADLLHRVASAGSASPEDVTQTVANFSMGQVIGADMRDVMTTTAAISGQMRGGEAGTAMDAFVQRLAVVDKKAKLGAFDEAGRFKGFEATGARLAEITKDMSEQQKLKFYTKTFGEGPAAALAAALAKADFGAAHAGMDSALSLDETIAKAQDTFNAQVGALGGSVETLKATLGEPLLDPFKRLATMANGLVGELTTAATEDPRIAQGVAAGAVGITGLAALAGLSQVPGTLAGALSGRAGGLATGLAEGKAAEAAGAQMVYVINYAEFPGGAGAASGVSGAAGAPAAAGGSKLGKALGLATVVGAGVSLQNTIGESVRDTFADSDSLLGKYMAFSSSSALRFNPVARAGQYLFSGGDAVDQNTEFNKTAYQDLMQSTRQWMGMDVKVTVDGEGVATATSAWRDGAASAQAASRVGP